MDGTVPALLFDALDRDPDRLAVFWPEQGVYKGMTRRQMVTEIAALARVLADRGVERGTPVGILAHTRREWSGVDLATLCVGGITVGIYPTLLPDQVAWQLGHSEVPIVIVEDAEQAAKVEAIRDDLPGLEHVVSMDEVSGLPRLDALRGPGDSDWLRQQAASVRPDDAATHVYTSGTTGRPKAAVLTHDHFVQVSRATLGITRVDPGDRSVVWLPLAHSLQRFTVYRGLLEDVVGYYAESIDKLPEALLAARPHLLASVPRMLEKIHARVLRRVRERGGVAKRVFDWALGVGQERLGHLERGEPVPLRVRVQFRLADRLVFRKIKDRLGGSLRTLVSGGAPLDPAVARFFWSLGIEVLEGWGLTETCAPATMNRSDDFRIGTVGKPLPGVRLRIAEDGEILVKSPGVFRGYHGDPDATAAAFTDDGWFRTGDIGSIDAAGFLSITDRKKEILVTAGGKNVAPVNIEKQVERSPYVAQAVAVGDGRPYLVGLLVPDVDALQALADREGWPDEPLADRLARPEVQALFDDAVLTANEELAPYESLKKWTALPTEFSVESGELTPTLKLKRRVVSDRYASQIDALYE